MMISLISGVVPAFKGDVWVTRAGTRFMNEDSPSPDEREQACERSPTRGVVIFDDAMLKANKPPLFNFDAHLQEGRVIKKAGSIEELAAQIGVPPAALTKTLDTYNGFVIAVATPSSAARSS